ncbi:uncharacterized protein [Onthophagus taurus]|uniref:uncharacterized protein n=1 Tax=Onthophagus taurus TaxID=166361 RepID=UPI0039BE3066
MALEEDTFDTIRLIQEVESRPILWDHGVPEYGNRLRKIREWEDVYKIFYAGWEAMKSSERDAAGRNIQKRWKNLRDNFMKDLKLQKVKSTMMKKKKKYIYFDKLQFLKKAVLQKRTDKWLTPKKEEQEVYDLYDDCKPEEHLLLNGTAYRTDQDLSHLVVESLQQEQQYEDEDRMFLLSLISDFKQIPQKRKLFVKSEILQVIMRAQYPEYPLCGINGYNGSNGYGQCMSMAMAVYSRSPSPVEQQQTIEITCTESENREEIKDIENNNT